MNLNLMITFLVSGLWHGANWTFIIWGGLHGFYQVIENECSRRFGKKNPDGKPAEKGKLSKFLHGLLTFALVSFAWIFFRANNVSDAFFIVTHLHRGIIHFGNSVVKMLVDMQLTYFSFGKLAAALIALMVYDYFSLKRDLIAEFSKVKWPLRWIFYVGVTCVIIVLKLHNGTSQDFIYFKF